MAARLLRNDNTIADTRPLLVPVSSLINPSYLSLLQLPHGTVLSIFLSLTLSFSLAPASSSLILDARPLACYEVWRCSRMASSTTYRRNCLAAFTRQLLTGEERRARESEVPRPTGYRIIHSCVAACEVLFLLFPFRGCTSTKKQERAGSSFPLVRLSPFYGNISQVASSRSFLRSFLLDTC